jgi:phenylpropionate dioxygenase-like ring-hydroxylating dioxygenase large terminal subunit
MLVAEVTAMTDLARGNGDGDGRYSVAFPKQWWYPACPSKELGSKRPLAITLMDTPLVLFRDGTGSARALLDRCPHRNVPLSLGRVRDDGCLQCAYHGWRFNGDGGCAGIPGLADDQPTDVEVRRVTHHATTEADGFVWVWGEAGAEPTKEPFALPVFDGPRTAETVFVYDLDSTLHSALENALDVPHTAFLHAGLFRGGEQRDITAVRRELTDGVEVEYVGEPVGFNGIRAGQDAELTFDHWDRFFLPSIAQIEYRVKGWIHIVNTILHLPISPFRTRAWFVVRYWTRLPAAVARPIVKLRGIQIVRQDVKILAAQADHVRRMGGERFTSTDLDVIGNAIWRMLRQAERAEGTERAGAAALEGEDEEPVERTISFRA